MTWRDWWVVTQILPFCYGIPVPDLTGTTLFGRLIRDWLSAFRDINFKRFTGTGITVSTKKTRCYHNGPNSLLLYLRWCVNIGSFFRASILGFFAGFRKSIIGLFECRDIVGIVPAVRYCSFYFFDIGPVGEVFNRYILLTPVYHHIGHAIISVKVSFDPVLTIFTSNRGSFYLGRNRGFNLGGASQCHAAEGK